jgi:lactoylglutathione lyase
MVVKLVGINHVAIEVGDLDDALAWYGQFFEIDLRGRIGSTMAFIDMGDQFFALAHNEERTPDAVRHLGLVVDDKDAVRVALVSAGVDVSPPPALDFHDPWGNFIQVVDYRDIQFTKTPAVARALGIDGLEKTAKAQAELRERGF